ncbi:MAG: hypothetical protein KC613_14695 [Myxococcales bacterium]|nr:hypothetical protein [Myxococcales bacterium]MCB9522494.1 hypothetical protein [Myxococcales bacterium]
MHAPRSFECLTPLGPFSQATLRDAHSVCRVSVAHAARTDALHAAFVAALPPAWRADPSVEIFSRLQWLKAGWHPMALSFHRDWAAPEGQAPRRVETIMVNLGGRSHTEFLVGPGPVPEPGEGERQVGARIAAAVEAGSLDTLPMPAGWLVRFDDRAWHRPTPATRAGWRLLIRAIRGLPAHQRHAGGGFTTVRNGYVPTRPAERARMAPYQDFRPEAP